MIPYIILFIIVLLLVFPFNNNKLNGYSNIFILITLPLLALFSGLASSRGDYLSYKDIFNDPFENTSIEKGYQLFNYLIGYIGGGYHLALTLIAFLAISTKLVAFKKLTPYLGLATIVYVGGFFVPADMGSIRFGVAMSFFLLSIPSIYNQNWKKFIFIIILGCTFHSSLAIVFIFYIVCRYDLKKKHYIIIFILATLSYLLLDIAKIINFSQTIIPNEYNIFLKALSYLDMKGTLNFAIIKRILILILITIYYTKLNKILPYFKTLYNAYFFSIITFLAFSLSFYLANRTSWLFASVEPVLLSGFIKLSNNNSIKFFIFIGIVAYSMLNLLYIIITQTDPPYNLYLPYKLFFE